MNDSAHTHGPSDPVGTVQVAIGPGALLITLTGEVDLELDQELGEAARAVREHGLPVMVDARRVTFMGSNGARFLSQCYTLAPLTVAASPPVRFLLRLLAMDDVLAAPE